MKIIQIAIGQDGPNMALHGLGNDGTVYVYDGSGWKTLVTSYQIT